MFHSKMSNKPLRYLKTLNCITLDFKHFSFQAKKEYLYAFNHNNSLELQQIFIGLFEEMKKNCKMINHNKFE